jgi:hypothetical protein
MRVCAERNVTILQELRFVAAELGYGHARDLPREVRHWWIGEMNREREARNARAPGPGQRMGDVPRGTRG